LHVGATRAAGWRHRGLATYCVVASPVFHRWHHTTEDEGRDTNFAGLFPVIDLAFGTFYMPAGRYPERFGVRGNAVPDGLWHQLMYPFGRREG
jgi:sterol desaturase/sphingolipid hydroxylase (fatty acid hydroxylase superfamily)